MAEEAATLPAKRGWPIVWRLPAAWRLLRDPSARWWEKALLTLAVVYVVMPLDLIPDFEPVLGWLDDAGVVALVAALLGRPLARYR